jgi:hypothetical protein
MDSFASELGVAFPVRLEAMHIIPASSVRRSVGGARVCVRACVRMCCVCVRMYVDMYVCKCVHAYVRVYL